MNTLSTGELIGAMLLAFGSVLISGFLIYSLIRWLMLPVHLMRRLDAIQATIEKLPKRDEPAEETPQR